MTPRLSTAAAALAVLALAAVTSCAANPPPVPVGGEAGEVSVLAGTWKGTYDSEATGRRGSIRFELEAGRDTARGQVMMVPADRDEPLRPLGWDEYRRLEAGPPPVEYLRIGFVTVAGSEVHGTLERYRDPACGCVVVTTFRGDLEGDRIRGTFTSYHEEGGERFTGEWEVERAGPDR